MKLQYEIFIFNEQNHAMPDNPHIPLPCGACGFLDAQFVRICLPFSVLPARYETNIKHMRMLPVAPMAS